MQGRGSGAVRSFALFGETTGETDEFGLPVRYNWAADYRGKAMVVYGHTPVAEPQWLNRTINIDTGCVFGGKLTALRYPEKEFVSVASAPDVLRTREAASCQRQPTTGACRSSTSKTMCSTLTMSSANGSSKRGFTGISPIREENAIAALEVMSRFATNPKWLIYLPPTMSPSETSKRAGLAGAPG